MTPPGPATETGATQELACVAHVHSTLSDGTATVEEIASAASSAGADAVLLTDHDTLEARRHGLAGWHDDVLLVVGHEISSAAGHLLAFGLSQEIDHRSRSAAEIWAAVRAADGIAFAAHPVSAGPRILGRLGRAHPWTDLDGCPGIGMELWSLVTDAAEAWRGPRDVLRFLRTPEASSGGPPPRAMAEWDRLCTTRRVPALGGLDAHQTGVRLGGHALSPMPHARVFGLLQTHVLCRVPDGVRADETAVLEALGEGRAFLARPWIADARGFAFSAQREDTVLELGAEAGVADGWTLRVSAPAEARLTLLRGGVSVAETTGRSLEHRVTVPGAYRVEARRLAAGAERLWILTNPVYLR